MMYLPKANIIEKSTCLRKCFFLAGVDGIEPSMKESKSFALPLGDTPVLNGREQTDITPPSKANAEIIP